MTVLRSATAALACALPGGHGHLGQSPQHDRLLQTHERHEGILQEVDFADQDVGRLCISWQLFHEFILQLPGQRRHSRRIDMVRKIKRVAELIFSHLVPATCVALFQIQQPDCHNDIKAAGRIMISQHHFSCRSLEHVEHGRGSFYSLTACVSFYSCIGVTNALLLNQ